MAVHERHAGPRGSGGYTTIVNHYAQADPPLDPNLVDDLPALQRALRPFLVRRPRIYRTATAQPVRKKGYRTHDKEQWAIDSEQMSPLGTLAVGLVQKGLVQVLQGHNNRYRIGFLSSFESLARSLDSDSTDWQGVRPDRRKESTDAPDTEFINRLAVDFEGRFGRSLPHPKIDAVVDRIAPLAFGTSQRPGGEKFLVFTRRISTVRALADRLAARHREEIEARVRRCWGQELDWAHGLRGRGAVAEEHEDDTEDPETIERPIDSTDRLRAAMADKQWLGLFRRTFRGTQRNALFFEDDWLGRLFAAGGMEPDVARVRGELWARSRAYARSSSGGQSRADRLRYLALHGIRECPGAFGLHGPRARMWRLAYEAALHHQLPVYRAAERPDPRVGLLVVPSLWREWDRRFAHGPMALPASDPTSPDLCVDDLHRRQVARTVLGQLFRLSDTVVDLYFADHAAQTDTGTLAQRFLDWLESGNPASRRLRHECAQWLEHLRLVVDRCMDAAGDSWASLARREHWAAMDQPSAVVGVTGGSGGHKRATQQFRMPSMIRVLVCTDTLKEGVDLHLFCDRVVHYGVAWTAGDLEQRVGRVDRFFSKIERRLAAGSGPPLPQLEVGYPHIVASLEHGQVRTVIERQRNAERLMDSPLGGASGHTKEVVVGGEALPDHGPKLEPYPAAKLPAARRPLLAAQKADSRRAVGHYVSWHEKLLAALERRFRVSPSGPHPVREATVGRCGLEWGFDAGLGRYVLTLSDVPERAGRRNPERRRIVDRRRRPQSILRALVPTPSEGHDEASIDRICAALDPSGEASGAPEVEQWREALDNVAAGTEVRWRGTSEARLVVPLEERKHQLVVRVRSDGVEIEGAVAAVSELGHRAAWGGEPTPASVEQWAVDETNTLSLGYLAVRRGRLDYGVALLHGRLDAAERARLVRQVAWRADAWEAALTGKDVR